MLADPKFTKDAIVSWIKDYFQKNGPECSAVIGISGGKDSSIAAALCVEALGRNRVFGVAMPNGDQSDFRDVERIINALKIPSTTINIRNIYDEMLYALGGAIATGVKEQSKINMPPRIRMAMLYAVAQSLPRGGRVVNTCNKSEDFVGYSTKYGDSAGDFAPLADLYVSEIKQIGYELPVIPRDLVDKIPADGLCGKTDEENLGFTYDQVEDFIERGTTGILSVDYEIHSLHKKNLHKLTAMPAFKVASR